MSTATSLACRGVRRLRCFRVPPSRRPALFFSAPPRRLCGDANRRPLGSAASGDDGRGRKGETVTASLGVEIAQLLRKQGLRLILHFDVNKTLIMVDPAGAKTQSQVLNSILAETCWGSVDGTGGSLTWRWDGCPPSTEDPSSTAFVGESGAGEGQRLTYSDFLHDKFGDAAGRDNQRMKDIRDDEKNSFTLEGQPGFGLRQEFLDLDKALSLPLDVSNNPSAKQAGLEGRESYYIIPSFFQCLVQLEEAGADFAIVFRTFGSDIEEVAREHNAFCEGEHPLFPGVEMDGRDGKGDYRVHLDGGSRGKPNVGAFYRDEEGAALVIGTLNNPDSREQLRLAEEKGHSVYRTVDAVHDAICETVFPSPKTSSTSDPVNCGDERYSVDGQRRCLALRDYYPYWRARLEEAEAGKLLPVDLTEEPKVWPVIFDDNIGRPGSALGAHIVDVRDAATGMPVNFDEAMNRHMVRAEPYLALAAERRDNYFLGEVLRLLPCDTNGAAPQP